MRACGDRSGAFLDGAFPADHGLLHRVSTASVSLIDFFCGRMKMGLSENVGLIFPII